MIGRRTFLTLLGGAAIAWPLAARAQQADRVRRVGILVPAVILARTDAFKKGMAALGWVEGRNIRFEERVASGPEQLPIHAAELARLAPEAIFVTGSDVLRAMRHATSDIPIVFSVIADPVGQGFVSSLARPGGNITGFANAEFGMAGKKLDLLRKLAPTIDRVALLYDPSGPAATGIWAETEAVVPSLGLNAARMPVRTSDDIEQAIGALAREPGAGLLVQPGVATVLNRQLIAKLAMQYRLPSVSFRQFVESGGLASYETDLADLSRGAASYVDRILKGEKPANLPVQEPTRYELVINLKTAKALDLTVPPTLLAIADEVIE
jgi:putative ABC transport system substrate-binding protein